MWEHSSAGRASALQAEGHRRHLAKVEVAGSSPVIRSKSKVSVTQVLFYFAFFLYCQGARRRPLRKCSGGTHYIKKVSYRTLIFQVLCCFLLFLLHFCHMALEACFHIFGVKRFDDTNTVVINVDNLIPLAVKIAGG